MLRYCYLNPSESSIMMSYSVTILLSNSNSISQINTIHNVTVVSDFLPYSKDVDIRMWLHQHPMIDDIRKLHFGRVPEQPRRRMIEPTIIFIVIIHIWIQVSSIKVHITLGFVLDITLNMSNIDHLFLQLSLFQKLDLSHQIGSLFLCFIEFLTHLCLDIFQLVSLQKTKNSFTIVRANSFTSVKSHLDTFCHFICSC